MGRRGREAAYRKLVAHQYLVSWGRWARQGSSFGLGYPSASAFVPKSGGVYYEYDEEMMGRVQQAITEIFVDSRDPARFNRKRRETLALYAFVLKIEYAEGGKSRNTQVLDVSRRFGKPKYSRNLLLQHLHAAVTMVGMKMGLGT